MANASNQSRRSQSEPIVGKARDMTAVQNPQVEASTDDEPLQRDLSFWIIMLALSLAAIIGTLDSAVAATSLPTIVNELDLGANYIWVTNIYFLTSAVFQPLYGQLSDLWGRRSVFIGTVAIFVLGSGSDLSSQGASYRSGSYRNLEMALKLRPSADEKGSVVVASPANTKDQAIKSSGDIHRSDTYSVAYDTRVRATEEV